MGSGIGSLPSAIRCRSGGLHGNWSVRSCRLMSVRWSIALLVWLVVACSSGGSGKEVAATTSSGAVPSFSFDLGRMELSRQDCTMDYQSALAEVDPNSGRVIWSTDIPWAFDAASWGGGRGLVVSKGRAVVGTTWTNEIGPGAVAVDLTDGSPIWQSEVSGHLVEITAVGGGQVMVATTGSVHMLDAASGAELWAYTSRPLAAGAAFSDDDGLVVVNDDGVLRALDVETGGVVWEVDADTTHDYPPLVFDRTVLLARWDEPLKAFNVADGRILWEVDFGSGGNTVVGQVGSIYVVFRSERRELVGIDQDGASVWSIPVPAEFEEEVRLVDGLIVSWKSVAVVDPAASEPRVIYELNHETRRLKAAGTEDLVVVVEWGWPQATATTLSVRTRTDGSLVWEQALGEDLAPAEPVVHDDAVLVGTGGFDFKSVDDPDNGNLTAFDLRTGTILWTTSFRDAVRASLPSGNILLVLSSDIGFGCQ